LKRYLIKLKSFYEETKTIELYFIKNHGINIVLEEEAIDAIIGQCFNTQGTPEGYYRNLTADFEHGLKLVREKQGGPAFLSPGMRWKNRRRFIAELLRQSENRPQLTQNPDNLLEG
jgi:ATP-dependent Clp protease ATP-binding subunit ClpX